MTSFALPSNHLTKTMKRRETLLPPGSTHGRWTVLSSDRRDRRVLCRCTCGTEAWVLHYNLEAGASVSCGCLRTEVLAAKHAATERKKAAAREQRRHAAPTLFERFISKFVVSPTGCWLWTSTAAEGRAQFRVDGKYVPAARVAYELFIDLIPDGMLACHTCDEPACVNPFHIFPGTHRDNVLDAISKGRFKHLENLAKANNRSKTCI